MQAAATPLSNALFCSHIGTLNKGIPLIGVRAYMASVVAIVAIVAIVAVIGKCTAL